MLALLAAASFSAASELFTHDLNSTNGGADSSKPDGSAGPSPPRCSALAGPHRGSLLQMAKCCGARADETAQRRRHDAGAVAATGLRPAPAELFTFRPGGCSVGREQRRGWRILALGATFILATLGTWRFGGGKPRLMICVSGRCASISSGQRSVSGAKSSRRLGARCRGARSRRRSFKASGALREG